MISSIIIDNNLNVVKAIPKQEIKREIEISTKFIEICCLIKGVLHKRKGSSSIDNIAA